MLVWVILNVGSVVVVVVCGRGGNCLLWLNSKFVVVNSMIVIRISIIRYININVMLLILF